MRYIFALIFISISSTANATEVYECRNGGFPQYEGIQLAEIVAASGEKVHARNDWGGCPDKDGCKQSGYLINGDKVLITPEINAWVCVYYLGKSNDYAGYVPKENINYIPYSLKPKLSNWFGVWKSLGGEYANSLNITLDEKGRLQVNGQAYWYGGQNSFNEDIVHVGQVSACAKPEANKLTIKEGDDEFSCKLNLELLSTFLVVSDNGNCGGMNVRFNAVYQQRP